MGSQLGPGWYKKCQLEVWYFLNSSVLLLSAGIFSNFHLVP